MQGRNYYIEKTDMTWEDAKNNCESKSMRLFEPRTPSFFREVHKAAVSLRGNNYWFWLGISDLPKKDGLYRYESDKKNVVDGMWSFGFPNDPDSHCVSATNAPVWRDKHCSIYSLQSICEEIQIGNYMNTY